MSSTLSAALLFIGGGGARAQDSSAPVSGPGFIQAHWGDWELGLDFGEIVPTQKKSFNHVIDNARAYDLLAGESVGDEVAEGFVAPPLPGSSVVAASLRNMAEVGVHAYRWVSPWLAFGLDGGYGFKRQLNIDSRGIYQSNNFLVLHYWGNLAHLSIPAKLGAPIGRLRPYIVAGPGIYQIYERATISFNDSDDPQLKPLEIVRREAFHFGLNGGAGLEWRVERGAIGVEVQYHKVFAGTQRADFFLPKLRLSVLF